MSGASQHGRGILITAPFPRILVPPQSDASTIQHIITQFNQAMAQIERAWALDEMQDAAVANYGVTDGSDALPGQIGEYVMANRTTNLSVPNNGTVDIASITLTAGDWDVQGAVYFLASSSAGSDELRAWVNTVSVTQPTGDFGGLAIMSTTSAGLVNMLAIPPIRASGTGTITVFLSCWTQYGTGSMNVQGVVRARRMR
jgi:hypothetical protein